MGGKGYVFFFFCVHTMGSLMCVHHTLATDCMLIHCILTLRLFGVCASVNNKQKQIGLCVNVPRINA
jgi:hypothetical protein